MISLYGMCPSLSMNNDVDIEMPCDEALWNAPTETKWREALQHTPPLQKISLREVVSRLLHGDRHWHDPHSELALSPYATQIVLHAASIQLWYKMQASAPERTAAGLTVTNDVSPSSTWDEITFALTRCEAMLSPARNGQNRQWDEKDQCALFSCVPVYRTNWMRACSGGILCNRMQLLYQSRREVLAVLEEYVEAEQPRNVFTGKTVSLALEEMQMHCGVGIRWVQKTGALTWNVDHAIAGWDTGKQVVSLDWVHILIEDLRVVHGQMDLRYRKEAVIAY